MIHFISGNPGEGKTLYAMRQIENELRLSKRRIVTNIEVYPEELAAYLHEKYGDTFDLLNRLQLLTGRDESANYWLYRGRGLTLERKADPVFKEGVVDYAPAQNAGGVFYVIDEVHTLFSARRWMQTGNDALYYLSQHRKLGDDVILISQHVKQVDAQMRALCQDFTYLKNGNNKRAGFFGIELRTLPWFSRTTYSEPRAANVQAIGHSSFRLDAAGLAKCYNTAAGVGIVGRDADTKRPKRGLSIVWLFVAIGLGGCAFYKATDIGGRALVKSAGVQSIFNRGVSNSPAVPGGAVIPAPVQEAPPSNTTAAAVSPGAGIFPKGGASGAAAVVSMIPSAPHVTTNIWINATYPWPGGRRWELSNGVLIYEADPRLKTATRAGIVYDGVFYPAR